MQPGNKTTLFLISFCIVLLLWLSVDPVTALLVGLVLYFGIRSALAGINNSQKEK